MPLILLWVGLALLRGFIDYGSSLSFRGWLSTRYLPAWCAGYRQGAHTPPSATAGKSDLLVHHSHYLYDLPAVYYLHSW